MYNSPYRTRPQEFTWFNWEESLQSPSLPMLPGIRNILQNERVLVDMPHLHAVRVGSCWKRETS